MSLPQPTKFLIDGIDRLGKSTLIQNIQKKRGYHLVIHYDKPKVLPSYLNQANDLLKHPDPYLGEELLSLNAEELALYLYQSAANVSMFELMKTDIPIIFDRTHLGELVYAPLYRKYSGEYVYTLERDFIDNKPYSSITDVKLILLTTSNFEILPDDGLSFDSSKKEEEQYRFIDAFKASSLKNKIMIDVHHGYGGYKPYEDILTEVLYPNELTYKK